MAPTRRRRECRGQGDATADRLAMTRLALDFNADSNRLSVGADPPRADMRHEGTGATDPGGRIGR